MAKKKGPKFGELHDNDKVEKRQFHVTRHGLESPSSTTVYFDCPYCKEEVKAYVWSLHGSGKRCDCKALFTSSGAAWHFKNQ